MDILTQEQIEEIYKDIRTSPEYMKFATMHTQYLKKGQYASAAIYAKKMKEYEVSIFAQIAKSYIDSNHFLLDAINSMTNEDRHQMNIITNAMYMLTDVLNIFVMDASTILKKYDLGQTKEYESLKQLLKETNKRIKLFDTLMKDEKASAIFGDASDNLYKMIFNKASSYVNKLKKYEESVNKKISRQKKVA